MPKFDGLIESSVVVKNISCGKRTTVVVSKDGIVYVCGDNKHRQLAIKNGSSEVLEMTKVQDLYYKVDKVACGAKHTLLLNELNQVYAVGDNSTGNLGQGHKYSSDIPLKVHGLHDVVVTEIAAGRHSAVLTDAGNLIVWGPALDPN